MKFYTLGCNCGCTDPLIMSDETGMEAIRIFRTKEDAQVVASEFDEPQPTVIECEVKSI